MALFSFMFSVPQPCHRTCHTPCLLSLSLQCPSLHSFFCLSLQILAQEYSLPGNCQTTWGKVSVCSHSTYFYHKAYSTMLVASYLDLRLPCSLGCEFLEGRYWGPFISISLVPSTQLSWHKVGFWWILNKIFTHQDSIVKWNKHWKCGGAESLPFGLPWKCSYRISEPWGSKRAFCSIMPQLFIGISNAWVLLWSCTKNFCRKVWHDIQESLLSHYCCSHSICSPLPPRKEKNASRFFYTTKV